MGLVTGTRYSNTDTYNIGIDMSDTLYMISPSDVPLLQLVGKDSLSTPCVAVKHEWLEDSLRSLDSAIATVGEFNGTSAITTATCTSGDGKKFTVGDIIKIDDEILCITSAMSTDTFTIAASPNGRGYGGSTAAAHVTLTPIYIIGNVNLQNAAPRSVPTTSKTARNNYTQIFNSALTVTSTQQALKKWVEQNEMSALLERELKVAWVQMERTLLNGWKVATTDAVAGAMDGILHVISTNAYAKSGAALTEAMFKTALKDCWVAGGAPTHVFVNWVQKLAMSTWLDSMRLTTKTDRVAGTQVDSYTCEFGTVDIVLDRNMPLDTVLIIEKGRIGFGPFSDHALKAIDIAQTTGLVLPAKQLYGQYTSETRNENAHAKITGLATS